MIIIAAVMNLFLDAKDRIENSKGLLPLPVLSHFIVNGLAPLYALGAYRRCVVEEFGLEEPGESQIDLLHKLSCFLELEDTLLSVADYILSKTGLKEFEKAIKLEEVRQNALLPLLKSNSWLCEKLRISSPEPILARHTPKGR